MLIKIKIHPLFIMDLEWGCWEKSPSRDAPTAFSSDTSSSSAGGTPRCWQDPWIFPQAHGGPQGVSQECIHKRCLTVILMQRSSGSTLSSSWVTKLLTLSLMECPHLPPREKHIVDKILTDKAYQGLDKIKSPLLLV